MTESDVSPTSSGPMEIAGRCVYLLGYYLAGVFGRRRPLLRGVKLIHACNLARVHCLFWKRKKVSLTFSHAVDSMKALRRLGVRIIILEGGGPFLRRDGDHRLDEVVAEA